MPVLWSYIVGRAVEPSTYIGIGALVTAAIHHDPSSAFLAIGGILGLSCQRAGANENRGSCFSCMGKLSSCLRRVHESQRRGRR